MVAQYDLCTMWAISAPDCGPGANERLTTVPIFALGKPTLPLPDHMEWMEHS